MKANTAGGLVHCETFFEWKELVWDIGEDSFVWRCPTCREVIRTDDWKPAPDTPMKA